MTDTRFTAVFDNLEGLLSAVDTDDVSDVETLLMALFARPFQVLEGWDDEAAAAALDVRIHGEEIIIGQLHNFPLSVVELARSCAELVEELGPYTRGTLPRQVQMTSCH